MHGTRRIPYRLHRGKRRGLRIAVTSDLSVNVFAPARAPDEWVEKAIIERVTWIARTLDKVAACEILKLPERFVDGTSLKYLGKEYRLAVIRGRRESVEMLFDTIIIPVTNPDDERLVHRSLQRWYRLHATDLFHESLERCLAVAASHGVRRPVVTVRNMRSRWGSCSSTGRVTLNLKLAMISERLIDYVVMHELCHLVHHNHSKQYYALLSTCMPDWRERKKTLNGYRMA